MRVSSFIKIAFAVALLMFAVIGARAESEVTVSRDQALARLRDGNARFVAGEPQAWNCGQERRQELATAGQQPIACIVTCSDARVSPEILFDQSLGDLFVVRLAGNVVTTEVSASVEYAVEYLQVPVVVVLGHTQCGAVRAALDASDSQAGPMSTLISRLRPAIESVKAKGFSEGEVYSAAINENARLGAEELLRDSRTIEEAVSSGRVTLLSAVYDLTGGTVHWQMQLMAAVASSKSVPHAETQETHAGDSELKPPAGKMASDIQHASTKPRPKRTAEETDIYARRYR